MPYVPPADITVIPKKERTKFQAALMERAFLSYAFSYNRLSALMAKAGLTAADLMPCVAAFNDDDEKVIKDTLNEAIAEEMAASKLTALRHLDPFGRAKDFLLIHSSSSNFNKQTAMDLLVAEAKVPAATVAEIWERSTNKSPFVTIQARDVKPGKGEGNGR